jgi:hypothetical protein
MRLMCPAMDTFFPVGSLPTQTRVALPKPQPRPRAPTQPTCAGSPPPNLRRALQLQASRHPGSRGSSDVMVLLYKLPLLANEGRTMGVALV